MSGSEAFSFEPPVLPMPDATKAVLAEQWAELGRAGTRLTGEQRVAVATTARAARRGGQDPSTSERAAAVIGATARRAAETVATDAGSITADAVDSWSAAGLDPLAYVELVGIVARTTAIDTAVIGLGADPVPFPAPAPGEPSGAVVEGAKRRSAWVPMSGGAGPTTALSAVAAEDRAQEKLHGALYLAYEEMGDIAIVKGLGRAQMELIASRTSYHNDCFFWLFAHAGMLRASATAAGHTFDLRAVTVDELVGGIPAGRELRDFADALIAHAEPDALAAARAALVSAIGNEGAARAALVAGNFEMMNRLVDATGVPVSAKQAEISTELGLPPFAGRH